MSLLQNNYASLNKQKITPSLPPRLRMILHITRCFFMVWLNILVSFYDFLNFLKSTQIGRKALCSLGLFMHGFVDMLFVQFSFISTSLPSAISLQILFVFVNGPSVSIYMKHMLFVDVSGLSLLLLSFIFLFTCCPIVFSCVSTLSLFFLFLAFCLPLLLLYFLLVFDFLPVIS